MRRLSAAACDVAGNVPKTLPVSSMIVSKNPAFLSAIAVMVPKYLRISALGAEQCEVVIGRRIVRQIFVRSSHCKSSR